MVKVDLPFLTSITIRGWKVVILVYQACRRKTGYAMHLSQNRPGLHEPSLLKVQGPRTRR